VRGGLFSPYGGKRLAWQTQAIGYPLNLTLYFDLAVSGYYRTFNNASAQRLSRGEAIMEQAVRSRKLSEPGSKAFLAAVDPFHDRPIDGLRGWPDLETGPSVVRHFKQSTTVKAIDEGGAIMIYTWPILNDRTCNYVGTRHQNVVDTIATAASTDSFIAPLGIYRFTEVQANSGSLPFNGVAAQTHAIPATYLSDGNARLIGMGFEVHDVTADIYKQGTLTVFEVPQTTADVENVVIKPLTYGATAVAQTNATVLELDRYPSTLSAIMTYPSSRQWDCKEGAYVVIPFTGHENPPLSVRYQTPWINTTPSLPTDSTDPLALNNTVRAIGRAAAVLNEPLGFFPNAYAPVNSRGVYLTGLNEKSTFTITTSFYIESFPVQSSELLPLAQPSCPFDPRALALISTVMKQMPVGVPLEDNFSSEWFWEAVQSALPVLGTVASALFPEFSPMIAAAAAGGTSFAARQLGQKPKKKKVQKQALKNEVKQMVAQDVKALGTAQQRGQPAPKLPSRKKQRRG
jgi:hypothetical protein